MKQDVSDQDKLIAALAWLIPVVMPARVLIVEELKARSFQRYHAVHSLAFSVAVLAIIVILALATFWVGGLGGYLGIPLFIIAYYWAFRAYQGEYLELPVITNFVKRQGWL